MGHRHTRNNCVKTGGRMVVFTTPRREVLEEINFAKTFISNFWLLELWENTFLLVKPQSGVCGCDSVSRLRQAPDHG